METVLDMQAQVFGSLFQLANQWQAAGRPASGAGRADDQAMVPDRCDRSIQSSCADAPARPRS